MRKQTLFFSYSFDQGQHAYLHTITVTFRPIHLQKGGVREEVIEMLPSSKSLHTHTKKNMLITSKSVEVSFNINTSVEVMIAARSMRLLYQFMSAEVSPALHKSNIIGLAKFILWLVWQISAIIGWTISSTFQKLVQLQQPKTLYMYIKS